MTGSKRDLERLGLRSLTCLDGDGKPTALPLVADPTHGLLARTSADTLFASLDYGVSNRGEGQAVLLRYHAKTQPPGGKSVGLPLEITPTAGAGGLTFVVTAAGQPLANTTVTLHEPGDSEPRAVTTDADGRTATYSKPGRYAVRVPRFEKVKGEHEGRAYTGVWEYSTLVTVVK